MRKLTLSWLVIFGAALPLFAEPSPVLDADFAQLEFEGDPDDSDGYVVGLDQAPDGSLYLATDTTLIKLDAAGNKLWHRKYGGQLVWAWNGVGVDNEGNAYAAVSDYINSRDLVLKYDGQGNLVKSYEFPYAAYMTGVAFDRQRDRLYALSYDAVTCFDKELNLIRSQALAGALPGSIWYEAGLDVDAGGNVYAGGWDYYGRPERYYAALKYAPELASIVWASTGSAIGELDRLNDLVAVPDGGACVSGVEYGRDTDDAGIGIRCFAADGQRGWGKLIPGGVDPAGLASDKDGNIYIGTALQDYSAAQLVKIDGGSGERRWTVTEPYGLQFLNTHVDRSNRVYAVGWPMAWGGGEFFVSRYLQGPAPDTMSPAAVADLAVAAVSSNSITLSWTAPGDDGIIGTATSYDLRYTAAGPVASDADFDNAAQLQGEPVPQAAGAVETFTLIGLTPGTTYFFEIKATDDAGNVSGLSNSPAAMILSVDTTPSAAVADLAAAAVSSNTVTLSWTAPGDDGFVGTASSYDIRYTTAGVIASTADFNFAIQAQGEPAPQIAGSTEAFTVTSLAPGTTYFFGIRTADEAGNISGLSNCVFTGTCVEVAGVPNWKQFDDGTNTWWDDDYDHITQKISALGCLLTSAAQVVKKHGYNTDPGKLNTPLIGTSGGFDGKSVYLPAMVDAITASGITVQYKKTTGTDVQIHSLLEDGLKNGNPVILELYSTSRVGRTHFVVATKKCGETVYINDPGNNNSKVATLKNYFDLITNGNPKKIISIRMITKGTI